MSMGQSLWLIVTTIECRDGFLVSTLLICLSKLTFIVSIGAATGTTVAGSTADPGPWSYQFSSPTAITFDQYGFMYVLDYNNDRVQKWLPGGSFGVTVAATSMTNPTGLRIDRLGNIIVCDTDSHRVISFGLMCRK